MISQPHAASPTPTLDTGHDGGAIRVTLPQTRTGRLVSLDAYRGAIMLLMASNGLGLAKVAQDQFPDSPIWKFIAVQVEHTPWAGCSLWDIIQPAFMFMVGVALPWSIANRQARGQTFASMFAHALWRALLLVLLAVFLTSAWSRRTDWIFTNVLAQIGLGYPFLFLLALTRVRTQWLAAGAILIGYWLAFALYPLSAAGFDWQTLGVPANWPHLTGFAAHWEKNANFASGFDQRFLNLFPREAPFVFNKGGYATLNFVPSLATMIFGLIAGQWLRSARPWSRQIGWLVVAGLGGIVVGIALGGLGVCPIVKRIWTPSWTIFSGGIVTLLLAGFVAVVEWGGWKRWTFPLVVVGLNPITLYCMWQLMGSFVRDNLKRHVGPHVFEVFGTAWSPVVEPAAVLFVFWLILWWMARRKIYIRI
jgi:predicted acyltransferase